MSANVKMRQVYLRRREKRRGATDEFYVVSTANTLNPRPGDYLTAEQVDAFIVLDDLDVRIEATATRRHAARVQL